MRLLCAVESSHHTNSEVRRAVQQRSAIGGAQCVILSRRDGDSLLVFYTGVLSLYAESVAQRSLFNSNRKRGRCRWLVFRRERSVASVPPGNRTPSQSVCCRDGPPRALVSSKPSGDLFSLVLSYGPRT